MKIKKVRLENFRGFVGVHEFELHSDHINVIIGANGAGKTSVLDAISSLFIKYQLENEDIFIGKEKLSVNLEYFESAELNNCSIAKNFISNFYDQPRAEGINYNDLEKNGVISYDKITVDKSSYKDELVLYVEKSNSSKVEFAQLSAGEKMALGMILEISHKAVTQRFPYAGNPLLAPGIVLIDEIELHLHPKWQPSILQALNKTFPNIQFIVTTHSPLVINHLKNENLILLNDFKITEGINVQNIYGRDVNSIITDFMGASAKPKEVESLINDIEVLLDEEKPDISLAKEKLNELKNITSPNHSDALKLETLITIEEED